MEVVEERDVTVVLSSHLVADLERVCDYLIVLAASNVQLSGDVESLLESHWRISGPRRNARDLPSDQHVIEESQTDKQSTFLIRTTQPIRDPAWKIAAVTVDDLVLAYMRQARNVDHQQRSTLKVVS